MKTRSIIIILFATVLTTSCGNEFKAKSVVEDFLDKNLADNNYSIENVSKIDSTFYINDSLLTAMRTKANGTKMFKNIKYPAIKNSHKKLIFIRVTYTLNNKNVKQTFYLDRDLKEVVAFKNN